MSKVILYYTLVRRTVVDTDNLHLSEKCQIVRNCNGFGVICVEGIEMHNTNETPKVRTYYRVYGDNGNANHDVVKNIDEAMSLFIKVVKTSKTRRIHLDREEYIGNRCLIYNLATSQTVHELKKSAGVKQ